MARSRRPELEKDNPTAPQLYVGPRRKRALSRATTPAHPAPQDPMAAALRTLLDAAEQFVNGVPYVQELDKERNALLEAITDAQSLVSVERGTVTRPARARKKG
ncbi:MAG: hypothetical protein WBB60_17025 [Nitrospira sp.]|nr:hypothetical protein [Nitrospira sp.]MBP6606093.1 hypothetical protein [Nitrospira sp.]MCI1280391.1 hypothetical protein [Nitrospira sp.]HQY59006.1 hypothetical protein [Nitrospira sp.]HRA97337.1 hypothetical protein [Nitrospira sp.]